MNKYYVYIHRRLSDGQVFYVGKGKGKRAYSTSGRNKRWLNTYNKHGFVVEIVASDLTEGDAFSIEKDVISQMRELYPSTMCNMTDGGEGVSGYVMSDSQKEECRKRNTGKVKSENTKSKISNSIRVSLESNSSKIDSNLYPFVKIKTGEVIITTRYDLSCKFNIPTSYLYNLVSGESKSIKGFALLGENESVVDCINRCNTRIFKSKRTFVKRNARIYNEILCFKSSDGTCIWASQDAFEKAIGKSLNNLISGRYGKSYGWTILKEHDDNTN